MPNGISRFFESAKRRKYHDESTNVSIVSVSRRAGPPHAGHVTLTNSGTCASGESPWPVNVVTCGSTGEFPTLTSDERRRVTETVVRAAGATLPVIAHTGALSTVEAVELSRHAQEVGAAAVMVVPPFYEALAWRELFAHYAAIASSIDIPIVVYTIPSATGVDLSGPQVAELAGLDGVEAIKVSSSSAFALSELIQRYSERISVLVGWDTLAFHGFVEGASGSIWGAANVIPELCVELFESARRKSDLVVARELWSRIWPICAFLETHGYVASVKAGCELVGHPVGPPRLPMQPLPDEDRARLAQVLRDSGVRLGSDGASRAAPVGRE